MIYAAVALLVFLVIAVLALIGMVQQQGACMTKAFDEMKKELGEINERVTEVANDIQTLVDKLNETPDQGLTMEQAAEISGELAQLKTRLTGVAAVYPPAPPPPPPPVEESNGSGNENL